MKITTTFLLFLFTQLIFSQSGVKGTIVSEPGGQPIPGVTVTVKSVGVSTMSDAQGNYFASLPPGKYDIAFSMMGFQPKIITETEVLSDDITVLHVSLAEGGTKALDEVVIKSAKARAESVKTLLLMQKNSINVSDGISAETIKRTPDKNTSDVLKRISGASIQDNKFVVIRGLNDRYNAAYLNGAPLPSSEPDRKAFSFDIFPANMLDNLVITKTATPDIPGEFAGGVIQINTKSIPDRNFQTISVGGGYNTITTGKKQLYYEGGKTDWLGLDDGTRELSSKIPDFRTLNSLGPVERAAYAKYLNSDWSLKTKNFAPNLSLQYTNGRRFGLGGDKVLGALFSVSYSRNNTFNETVRKDYEAPADDVPSTILSDYNDKNYIEQYMLGLMGNFSLKFNANNSISFKNIFSINSDDKVVERFGAPDQAADPNALKVSSTVRWFTSNTIYSGQLYGEHFFPASRTKFNWMGAYSRVSRDIPNLRRNSYTLIPQDPDNPSDVVPYANIADGNAGTLYGGSMFFSENNEDIYSGKADYSAKISDSPVKSDEIKFGGFVQYRNRDFYARQLQYNQLNNLGGDDPVIFNGDLLLLGDSAIFQPENIGVIAPNVGGFTIFDGTKYFDAYTASSELQAAYIMLDNNIGKLRLIWGFRTENYIQRLETEKSDTESLNVYNEQTDFLPSANAIFALNEKQNLRLSYSKTLNRPEFRELAPFGFYDFMTQNFTNGNPELGIAVIDNADVRYEIFPGKNQLFSVSAFYKKFKNPIETVAGANNKEVTFGNANSAKNYGFEMEFRALLGSVFNNENSAFLNGLTVFSNLAVIKSEVDASDVVSITNQEKSRPMQGQSPYVFNLGTQYIDSRNGWSLSANLNRIGDRIAIVGNPPDGEPTLWEQSRTLLDAQLSKTFLNKRIEIRLNMQNLLDQESIFYQNKNIDHREASGIKGFFNNIFTGDSGNNNGYDKNDDLFWKTKKFGRTFSLTATYNF
ncbi:hypothetical protein HYN48_03850 [Flavobacterium magnum]|uniref:TonB-dependent receptor n=1 Tax=Flavobacterium magnum TaxID=2162713 RepID=A0A2S0RDC4_9FLAO|nr:TonB-dependent receptor [Flavobacterium magnum]AWA29290.1 hypothetical protein HYN48_03850 [Flavobacterium magnum]